MNLGSSLLSVLEPKQFTPMQGRVIPTIYPDEEPADEPVVRVISEEMKRRQTAARLKHRMKVQEKRYKIMEAAILEGMRAGMQKLGRDGLWSREIAGFSRLRTAQETSRYLYLMAKKNVVVMSSEHHQRKGYLWKLPKKDS